MTPDQMAELAARLHDFGKAYPVEIFSEITDAERAEHSGLITRAAAQMGRHFAKFAVPAADLIADMAQRVLDEPVAFRDPETGDFSRVRRVGWQQLYLYPQAHGIRSEK